MRKQQTEVLVVGAGPVGLLTAVVLAEAGIEVQVIDREERTAGRSYACALHQASLELLERLGLLAAVLEAGHRVDAMAFYDDWACEAEIRSAETGSDLPFLVVLPQSTLEEILERRLRQKGGVSVLWNHRFDGLESDPEAVVATVERLEGTALGYVVPHWETVVQKRFPIRAKFLVGADGPHSLVRQRLAIEYGSVAPPQCFVACEFTTQSRSPSEVRVVLNADTTNVLWPLSAGSSRWTLQLVHSETVRDFPEKERRAVQSGELVLNENIRRNLQRLTCRRAPWFSAEIGEILWCKQVAFAGKLANRFGSDRCWLAGDAAHQTGPVGVQSLNAGLAEADALAAALRGILREKASLTLLESYNRERQTQWGRLLGLTEHLKPTSQTTDWVRRRFGRILPCIPATGVALNRLALQLGLEFAA